MRKFHNNTNFRMFHCEMVRTFLKLIDGWLNLGEEQ